MKLYTEEQVKRAISLTLDSPTHSNLVLDHLTPIELPSDDEIENKGKWVFNNAGHTIYTHYNTVPSWVAGAIWMREQIGGNK
jgi:hypothetical protein